MARSLRQRKAMKDRPISEQALHAMFSMARNPCDDPWADYSESAAWFKRRLLSVRQAPLAAPTRQAESRKRKAASAWPNSAESAPDGSGDTFAGGGSVEAEAASSSNSSSSSASSGGGPPRSVDSRASDGASIPLSAVASAGAAVAASGSEESSHVMMKPPGPPAKKIKKKQRLVRRGTSPSHFLVSELEELRFGPQSSLDAPNRDRIDALFRAVGCMYFRPREVEDEQSVWVSGEYDISEYSSLDMLVSPLRRSNPLDDWSPRQIALFECGICKFGKDFPAIAQLIGEKTTAEVVHFYYACWKKSTHYQIWKSRRRPAASAAAANLLV